MSEPTCPECATVVLPTWDWCHGCGFDPEGLRPEGLDRRPSAAPVGASSPSIVATADGSAAPAAGWYADPGGSRFARYWDGTRWTEHLHDPGVAAPTSSSSGADTIVLTDAGEAGYGGVDQGSWQDDESLTIDLTGSGPLVDTIISQPGLAKKRLVVTREGLSIGKTVVDFAQVSGFTHWVVHRSMNGIPAATDRRLVLATSTRTEKIVFGHSSLQRKATKQGQSSAFETTISVCHEVIGRRLCATALAHLREGQEVVVDRISLREDGFVVKGLAGRKFFTWAQYAGGRLHDGEAQVYVEGGEGRAVKAAGISLEQLNSVLLPTLMELCAQQPRVPQPNLR